MNKELQDKAWRVLPKEFKEEVKKYFAHYRCAINTYEAIINHIFGRPNLTSDAGGEEMLTVSRKDVVELYQEVQKTISSCKGTELAMQSIGIKNVLWSFFGSKCLPDDTKDDTKDETKEPSHPNRNRFRNHCLTFNPTTDNMKYKVFESSDTNVKKFVFEFDEPKAIAETVLYRYGDYRKRTVICCSVQSGCNVGCAFCGTGKFFVRNLTRFEIIRQIEVALSTIDCDTREIEKFQIMFMSMGEPMDNFSEVEEAIFKLAIKYPNAQLLISTSAPALTSRWWSRLVSLSQALPQVGIQFSVHESTDKNRAKLIPTNTCTLRQIASLGEMWAAFTGRKPFFNYCVHAHNSTPQDAERLAKIFNPDVWEVTLSVICQKSESVKSSIERQLDLISGFQSLMLDKGFSLRVFNPAGQDDIGGGCGQLWYFQQWLRENVE